jgi:hypothetical protein
MVYLNRICNVLKMRMIYEFLLQLIGRILSLGGRMRITLEKRGTGSEVPLLKGDLGRSS